MQKILEDSTESILTYPPDSYAGQATSADVRVRTPSTDLPDTDSWQSATIDSVSATTNAAAAKGADELSFASTPSATAGRRYLLELADGHTFSVEVIADDGAGTVTLAEPLPMAVPTSTPFKGYAITHALTAAESSDVGEGLVKVRATIASVEYRWDHQIRIVRERLRIPLTGAELSRLRPEIRDLRSPRDEDLSETIDAAWQTILRPNLRGRNFHEDRIKSHEDLQAPLASACVLFLKRSAGVSFEAMELAERDFRDALNMAIASSEFWYDKAQDDNVRPGRQHPTDHEIVRVTR